MRAHAARDKIDTLQNGLGRAEDARSGHLGGAALHESATALGTVEAGLTWLSALPPPSVLASEPSLVAVLGSSFASWGRTLSTEAVFTVSGSAATPRSRAAVTWTVVQPDYRVDYRLYPINKVCVCVCVCASARARWCLDDDLTV